MSWAADHYVLYEMDGSGEKKILSASAISNVTLPVSRAEGIALINQYVEARKRVNLTYVM